MATTIFDVLKKDHEKVKKLFEQASKAKKGERRSELLAEIRGELVPHSDAESKTLYKAMLEHEKSRDEALEGEEEHRVAKRILADLERLDTEDERWPARLKVLKEVVEHHVEEEEDELFDAARKVLDDQQQKELVGRFQDAKKRIAQR